VTTLVLHERYPAALLAREGLALSTLEAYVEIGFVEPAVIGGEWYFTREQVERLYRAERIRRELGANLIGAYSVLVEPIEPRKGLPHTRWVRALERRILERVPVPQNGGAQPSESGE
jgi:DNA-binding transcriptional MerR regulator